MGDIYFRCRSNRLHFLSLREVIYQVIPWYIQHFISLTLFLQQGLHLQELV